MVYTNLAGVMERKARKTGKRPLGRSASGLSRKKPTPPRRDAGLKKASLFMNGRSQAVRLPKEFRFAGTHVFIRRSGDSVILSSRDDRIERLIALMGSSPDFPDVERGGPEPMRPELEEFFGVSD